MAIKLHVFAAPADKFFVNSFLIETSSGVVLVDTQFLLSTARELRSRVDALGAELDGVIITHPHPDHYNGLPVVLDGRRGTPAYATAPTIAGIRATQAEKRAAWTPVYGADYPTEDRLPDREVGPDATLRLAGTELRVIDLGAFECMDNAIVHVPEADALIASDLIYNDCHPWLAEHRTGAWLERLDDVQARFGGVGSIYAGHGPAGTSALFDRQRDYITAFRALVAHHARKGGEIPTEAMDVIVAETRRGREGWPLEGLIAMNAQAVARELAGLA